MRNSSEHSETKLKTDFRFRAKSKSADWRESWQEERGLRAQRWRNFRLLAARTGGRRLLARTRSFDRRNPSIRMVGRIASPHAAGKIVGWHCGRRVPTLQFRAAWRASRRWPISPGRAKRKHNQERRGTKESGSGDLETIAAATANSRGRARTASRD